MEIRCAECDYLGAAAEVRPVDGGMGLVCDNCGHVNIASADTETNADADDSRDDDGSSSGWAEQLASMQFGGGNETTSSPSLTIDDDFIDNSVERLMPEKGSGRRCRKCVHLFDEDLDHCSRCGLSVAEAESYPEGEAPWEKPAPDQEESYRRAESIWESVHDETTGAEMDDYVEFVIERGLVDFGIRRIQYHLVEHPDDTEAVEGLSRLARSLEVAVEVASTRAESEADQFTSDVRQFRTNLLIGALIFWTALLLLFSWLFWGTF